MDFSLHFGSLQSPSPRPSWAPRTVPKAFKNPVFWAHVSKMLSKRLQSDSKGIPRRAQNLHALNRTSTTNTHTETSEILKFQENKLTPAATTLTIIA